MLIRCLVLPLALALTPAAMAQDDPAERIESGEASDERLPDTPDDAEDPERDGSGSPFEYESSEEISRDLSVSFPVDI